MKLVVVQQECVGLYQEKSLKIHQEFIKLNQNVQELNQVTN